MKLEIFTDGSATVSSKPGGWACVLVVNGQFVSERCGHIEKATNNDMELFAAIKGLELAMTDGICCAGDFEDEFDVTLKSDSQLVLGWANGTYQFKQTEKLFLYEELRRLMRKLKAKTEWVKGHSGVRWNERCDELANKARLGIEKEQKKEEAKTTGETLIGDKRDGVICLWYGDKLKIISLSDNIIEDYNREVHGKRGSAMEIRQEKMR